MVNNSKKVRGGSSSGEATLDGKRIIIPLAGFEIGGAERQALLLARYLLEERNARVQIWGYGEGPPGPVAALCEEYGITWRLVPTWPWADERAERLKRLAQFAWLLRSQQPDILLPYLILSNVVCGRVWRWTGAKLCIWNQRDGGLDRIGGEWRSIRQTPWFVANSQGGADYLIKELRAPAQRVRVIHNGVTLAPPQSDPATWRNRLELSQDCFVACMVANLTQFKDHHTLLRAWRRVVDALESSGRAAVLLLAGRLDNNHYQTKALAYDLELGKSVRFLGPVRDIAGLLGAVDLCVFSSLSEGSPNGVLEGMAAGLAVAGTDIPGIREAVGADGHEFLALPGEDEPLAAHILKLATNQELRARLGEANRRRIQTEFSPQRMCERTSSLMIEALQGKPL